MDDGYVLPVHRWSVAQAPPRALVLGLHGFNDYANAFAPLGRDLAELGIITYAVDQRGFGASALPGRWHGSERLSADLRILIDLLRQAYPDLPLYLAGESMGGAVILAALAEGSLAVDGVILMAPAVWSRQTMPWYQRLALDAAAHTVPWLKLTGEGIRISPSDHLEMLRALGADPLVIKATRVDALWGITDLMDRASLATLEPGMPILLLYGEQDHIIPANAFCQFLSTQPATAPDLTLVLYEQGWHMLTRDLQGPRVRADIAAWIATPAEPLPSGETTFVTGARIAQLCDRATAP
ncbi:alpha/beta hydrolase [Thiocapsa imhoffii]|nr:alpha/beta hydrolase [Thiocapsa imhoffii]